MHFRGLQWGWAKEDKMSAWRCRPTPFGQRNNKRSRLFILWISMARTR
jgi:hypothetical protein